MNDDNIFATEIRVPDEFNIMLNVSVNHEKLENVLRFVLNLLKRHEGFFKSMIEKQEKIYPKIDSFEKSQNKFEENLGFLSKNLKDNAGIVEKIQENLNVRHDTSETLKFLLGMITEHDSLINKQKSEFEEAKNENLALNLRVLGLESEIKEITKKINAQAIGKAEDSIF